MSRNLNRYIPFSELDKNFPLKWFEWIFIVIGSLAIISPAFWIINLIAYYLNQDKEEKFFSKYFFRRVFFFGIIGALTILTHFFITPLN